MTNSTYRPEMLKLLTEEQRDIHQFTMEQLALALYRLLVAERTAQLAYRPNYALECAIKDVNAELGIEEMG
jgi:hypothetical protein